MKRKKFLKAKKIDEGLARVDNALKNITKYNSFKDNHKTHLMKLESFSETKGMGLEIGGTLFDSKDMGKIADTVAEILVVKKAKLEKDFAEL